jgi:uncharacterized protein YkwD
MKDMSKRLKKFFVPHEANKYRPQSLKKPVVGTLLIITVLLEVSAIAFLFVPNFASTLNNFAAVLPAVLIAKANETRQSAQLGELVENPILTHAATIKAQDMAARGYFAHVDPDGNQPWHYLGLAGYQYVSAGENLAVNFTDSTEVHRAWLNSPTHKANIVRPQFTEIGIGTARGMYKGKDVIFVVQFFGIPQAGSAVARIAPAVTPPVTVSSIATTSVATNMTPTSSTSTIVAVADTGAREVRGATTDDLKPTLLDFIKSAPRTTILYVLAGIAGLVLISLILKIGIARHIQHKDLIWHGILLLVIAVSAICINYMLAEYVGEVVTVDHTNQLTNQ